MTTQTATPVPATEKPTEGSWYHGFVPAKAGFVFLGISRILLGLVFLWAFLDKTFGLGWATPSAMAWKFGTGDGSPTYGFLKFGTNPDSPLQSTWNSLAKAAEGNPNAWSNWLFMAGLLGIGIALTFGVFMRIGSVSAVVLLALMWLAEWPLKQIVVDGQGTFNAPGLDDHIVYAVLAITLMLMGAERYVGLGKWWENRSFVKKLPWLA
jgi:thiosulfate dehydrogenase (quinone) large subunit